MPDISELACSKVLLIVEHVAVGMGVVVHWIKIVGQRGCFGAQRQGMPVFQARWMWGGSEGTFGEKWCSCRLSELCQNGQLCVEVEGE